MRSTHLIRDNGFVSIIAVRRNKTFWVPQFLIRMSNRAHQSDAILECLFSELP